MTRPSTIFTSFLILLQLCCNLQARPTTANEAEKVVAGWLKTDARPLGAALGRQVTNVETYINENDEPIYYIVYLQPSGFVIVSADDLVQPIIGFVEKGTYDPSPDNPLGALVNRDLKGRIAAVRDIQKLQATAAMETALNFQSRWEQLTVLAKQSKGSMESKGPPVIGLPSVSDPRVDPLLLSKWGQTTCCAPQGDPCALACYNYYTPPSDPCDPCDFAIISSPGSPSPYGNPNNYPCGCLATAMAQLMRFHEFADDPNGIGKEGPFGIFVNGIGESAWTRGGNGLGGPYNWNLMVYEPNCNTAPAQRQAIGALCYDAGVTVFMAYGPNESSAFWFNAAFALRDPNIFAYNNAFCSTFWPTIPALIEMINPNLDYNHPVILNLAKTMEDEMGHAVVADGYGYNLSTLYHHINMGWDGNHNAWYNLPSVYDYNSVLGCIYNIFVSGTGEIISGRVIDANGISLSGATVTAQGPAGPYIAVTNTRGIYALGTIQPGSTYNISVTKPGYKFKTKNVTTGTSSDWAATSGNKWGIDFRELPSAVYVDINATGNNGGTSWDNAYNYLQDGLANVWTNKILVADGNYMPDQGAGITPGDKTATFQLINGVTIYGGYAGVGAPDPNARDIQSYETILSGDIGIPDNNSDNSYHVATGSGTEPNAVLDGLTITAGNAKGALTTQRRGGGIYNVSGDPTLRNCTFTSNSALFYGGGMYNESASPILSNCTFTENSAFIRGGGMFNEDSDPNIINCTFSENSAAWGGGIFNWQNCIPNLTDCNLSGNWAQFGGGILNINSSPTLTRCTFVGNSATSPDPDMGGGGMYNINSSSTLTDCTFIENSAEYAGGGIYIESSNLTINNCTFSGNSANSYGGGLYRVDSDYLLTLTNCAFNNNSAILDGGGIYNNNSGDLTMYNCALSNNMAGKDGGGIMVGNSEYMLVSVSNCTFSGNSAENFGGGIVLNNLDNGLVMFNCILWGNTANLGQQITLLDADLMMIGFSDVQDGYEGVYCDNCVIYWGPLNIDVDPMFIGANDFHLLPGSPCIDTGENSEAPAGVTTDLDGRPRFVDGDCNDIVTVDIGAYEFAYAYIGDFDDDCDVDFVDFAILASYWLQDGPSVDIAPPPEGDGIVDLRDLEVLCKYWLAGK